MITKSTIFLFFIASICNNAFAQTYKPFPTDYGKWVYEYKSDENYVDHSTLYELQNDIVISSKTYKKISVNSVYVGGIREEDKIIYFYPDTSTKEYVLYNFNLLVNDIISDPFGELICGNEVRLTEITYVNASDGQHKYYHFSNGAFWIEGIGSLYYLLHPFKWNCCATPYCNDELKCMTSDETFQYPSTEQACIVTSNQEQIANENILVFPNPSSNSFLIDFKNHTFLEIHVTDILGTIVYHKKITDELTCEIPTLKAGTYSVSLIDINNRILHKKIMSVK